VYCIGAPGFLIISRAIGFAYSILTVTQNAEMLELDINCTFDKAGNTLHFK
jgi:hypothetical protein